MNLSSCQMFFFFFCLLLSPKRSQLLKDHFCLAAALMELQETPSCISLRKPQELLLNKWD